MASTAWVAGCIGGAEAKMAEPTAAGAPSMREVAPETPLAPPEQRWRFTSLVEHGPAGFIGSNAQWDLTVYEVDGEPTATLRKLAVDGETLEPSQELSATFAFAGRPLDERQRATVAGTRWESAEVVDTEVDLRGPFHTVTLELRVWFTDDEIVGVWSTGVDERRGGPLVGSARAASPTPLRDVEGLPCALRCEALGHEDSEAACVSQCMPKS